MPSHDEILPLIPTIQTSITHQINVHPNHTYILCGNFNRDIALIKRQNDQQTTPPQNRGLSLEFINNQPRVIIHLGKHNILKIKRT